MTDPSTASDALARALEAVGSFGGPHAAAAVVGPAGVIAEGGHVEHAGRWASVTKLVTAIAVLQVVEQGGLQLDDPAPKPAPDGATIRHLLAHTSGLAFDGPETQAGLGRRRIYSNTGFDILGDMLATHDGTTVETVLRRRVLDRLGMADTTLVERASQGLHGPLADLARFARELLRPTLLQPATLALATTVAFPDRKGVLPGVGSFDPLDWGLGFELRDGKSPHWTGTRNSPATFGHFGGSGSFLWVDPALAVAMVCLSDRAFGPWALEAWPAFEDAVIDALRADR